MHPVRIRICGLETMAPMTFVPALAVFTAVRHFNVQLIESLPPDALSKPVTHPERGAMTFQSIVETAGRTRSELHLGQPRKVAVR